MRNPTKIVVILTEGKENGAARGKKGCRYEKKTCFHWFCLAIKLHSRSNIDLVVIGLNMLGNFMCRKLDNEASSMSSFALPDPAYYKKRYHNSFIPVSLAKPTDLEEIPSPRLKIKLGYIIFPPSVFYMNGRKIAGTRVDMWKLLVLNLNVHAILLYTYPLSLY